MKDLYKFYIVNGEVDTQIQPLDYPVLSWAKNEEDYKKEDVEIEITGASYDTVFALTSCSDIYLKIVRQFDLSEVFRGRVFWKGNNEKTKILKLQAKEITDKDAIEANDNINVNIFETTTLGNYSTTAVATVEETNIDYDATFANSAATELYSNNISRLTFLQPTESIKATINIPGFYADDMFTKVKHYSAEGVLLASYTNQVNPRNIELKLVPAFSYLKLQVVDYRLEATYPHNSTVNLSFTASTNKLSVEAVMLESGTSFSNSASYRKFANAITIDTIVYDIYFAYVSRTKRGLSWVEISNLFYTPYDAAAAIPTFFADLVTTTSAANRFFISTNTGNTQYVTCSQDDIVFPALEYNFFSLNGQDYTNGVFLRDVINQAIQIVDSTNYCVSSFLFGDEVETGSTWTPTDTGNLNSNSILLFAASDIKNPNASEKATYIYTTLSAILEMLKMFNCYTFIDENGFYRIEHISYKFSLNTVDLRNVEHQKGTVCIDEKQVLEYTSDNQEGVIIFKPAVDSVTQEGVSYFGQSSIVYKGNCIDKTKVKTIQMNSFIFDYDLAIAGSDDISNNAIVVITKNIFNSPSAKLSPQNILYFLYQHEANYQFYDMPSLEIENREAITLANNVAVETINYPEKNSLFEIKNNYKTYYKDGSVVGILDKAVINTRTGNVELNLLFAK